MARKSESNVPARQRSRARPAVPTPSAVTGAGAGAQAPALPMTAATYLLPWIEQVQRVVERTSADLTSSARVEQDEAGRATLPLDLLTLQAEWAAQQCARLTQMGEEMLAGLLDVQTLWIRDAEAFTAQQLRLWLGVDGAAAIRPAAVMEDLPEAASPTLWFDAAQKAWTGAASTWLDALGHDLQAGAPAPQRA